MYELFIAEKPDAAKKLADKLAAIRGGKVTRSSGYYDVSPHSRVTYAFGHMLELMAPEDISPDYAKWRQDNLPIVPASWRLSVRKSRDTGKPDDGVAQQLGVIKKLVQDASCVWNVGDADTEGEAIVRNILLYCGYSKPHLRLWLGELTEDGIRKGLRDKRPSSEFDNIFAAQQARSRGDWLVGLNGTRAFTTSPANAGGGVLSTGRVQTPTLALVVARCRAIRSFVPQAYFSLAIVLEHAKGEFRAAWKPPAGTPVDDAGRIVDKAVIDAVVRKVQGKTGSVANFTSTKTQEHAPLAMSTADMQKLASTKLGFTAQQVLDGCDALYQLEWGSYPRTECQFLDEESHTNAARILAAIAHNCPALAPLVARADATLKHKAFNDKKIDAHAGLRPTVTKMPAAYDEAIQNEIDKRKGSRDAKDQALRAALETAKAIYPLYCLSFLALFFPPHEYEQLKAEFLIEGEAFSASGRVPLKEGWKEVAAQTERFLPKSEKADKADKASKGRGKASAGADDGADSADAAAQVLPPMARGDAVKATKAATQSKETKPPAYYTEATLIEDMESAAKFATSPAAKEALKKAGAGDEEGGSKGGIGTPATRASFIEVLKKRGFIEAQGRKIVSTPAGEAFVSMLPPLLTSLSLCVVFEQELRAIRKGEGKRDDFVQRQTDFTVALVDKARALATTAMGGVECPQCRKGSLRLRKRKSDNKPFWGCSNWTPADGGCRAAFDDDKGKPNLAPRGQATSPAAASPPAALQAPAPAPARAPARAPALATPAAPRSRA